MPKFELTNMVMLQDKNTGKVLVQDRIKSWKGWAFPGGHVENNESFVDSAIREIKEETGLDINHLKSCGILHWLNNKTLDRYVVLLYKTNDFWGDLITDSDEGRHFWVTVEELKNHPTENDMPKYLPMFFDNKYSEAFGSWNDSDSGEMIYK